MIRCVLLRINSTRLNYLKYSTEAARKFVKIGNVRANIHKPKKPYLVPIGFGVKEADSSVLSHLKWLLQKDSLKQDVFLIGAPGALRSNIVLQYLELCGREFEYLSITRDTTEADIKQRREIRNGTAFYTDLCAVRAALNGRVLVIDGVEKAERNVLPILNSLLESREMQLDDGRFLIAADKYDKLVEEMGEERVRERKLERVSENFLVVALGLPVPPFKGHTLDPPLRSRFQCRQIDSMPFATLHQLCTAAAPNIASDRISSLISLCLAINSSEASSLALPRFPIDNLINIARIWNLNPFRSAEEIFGLGYPYETLLRKSSQVPVVKEFLQKFTITDEKPAPTHVTLDAHDGSENDAVSIHWDNETISFKTPQGSDHKRTAESSWKPYVSNVEHDRLLADMAMSHAVGDFCVVGPKGSGKTTVVEQFAKRMGYSISTMTLYHDMNSRELLQERRMLPNGDTVWEDSVLVDCAKQGRLCILDGIERIHWSALEVLAPLIHHRQIELFDGNRLLDSSKFNLIAKQCGLSKEQLEQKGVFEIDPSFRIIAIGDSENKSGWMNEQVLSLFPFHVMKALSIDAQHHIIESLVPNADPKQTRNVIKFVESLHRSSDTGLRDVAGSLSLRKLVHIIGRSAMHRDEDITAALSRAALSRFLPVITHDLFEKALRDANIDNRSENATLPSVSPPNELLKSDHVRIGTSVVRRNENSDRTMVPDVLFYDNAQHVAVMSDMARDMELGSHLLLIGNQGVGKNKVTDRFLHLINRPRQYLQLHRDTTVQSLTVHSTVIDGRLILEDSPLVRAAREGNVLVIDEADKAPLHVVAVLKSLLDTGVMRLADGRVIEPKNISRGDRSIPLHPDFRIIMLANRPGFPFLGNDLFSILGDLFSVHIVDNPSRESEFNMLKKYAPNVDENILTKLCAVFDELRAMADESLLPYPYSTRELVNIAKHIESYPTDGLTAAVRNVFDFDKYSRDTLETVERILHKHGIPFGVDRPHEKIFLAVPKPIPPMSSVGEWSIKNNAVPDNLPLHRFPLRSSYSNQVPVRNSKIQMEHMRSNFFTEQEYHCQLDIDELSTCSSVASFDKRIAVTSVFHPFSLHIIDSFNASRIIDLSFLFPSYRSNNYIPIVTMRFISNDRLLLYEEMTNTLLEIDLESNRITELSLYQTNFITSVVNKLSSRTQSATKWRFNPDSLMFFERQGRNIRMLDADASLVTDISLPEGSRIQNVLPVNPYTHLIELRDRYALMSFEEDGRCLLRAVDTPTNIPKNLLCSRNVEIASNKQPLHIIASDQYYAITSNGFPMTFSVGEVNVSKREQDSSHDDVHSNKPYQYAHPHLNSLILDSGHIVRAMPHWRIPAKAIHEDISPDDYVGVLEIVDPLNENVRYIPIPSCRERDFVPSWVPTISPAGFVMAKSDGNSIITCDTTGGLRRWQITQDSISSALNAWEKLFGDQTDESLRLEFGKDDFDMSKLDDPKIGKVDPANTPHVGGGTWAGGTGGYNTAGLGGVGGPFRLDAGHDVHQLPQNAKDAVPEHIRRKAREIAKSEYKKRLHEIDMSEHDAKMYNALYGRIEKQSRILRSVIDSLEAKAKERQWIRHQTNGDLDDAKLVEGITGERTIYRRRIDQKPDESVEQNKPKRIRFCFDVSGSMYRFNGYDQRLQRSLESALLVMESLHGKHSKIIYDIVGHSGESEKVSFVKLNNSPSNENSRLKVLKKMLLHSQFCMSGDSTLECMQLSADEISKEDSDERFVVVVSDANFDRYGIRPNEIIRSMTSSSENVNISLILIGSLGEQAERLQKALPSGRVFICKDATEIPLIMQNIFSSTLLR